MDERARIAMLARTLGARAPGLAPGETGMPGLVVGIGDDAAVLDPAGGGRLVWTIDEQVEGTHFRRAFASWNELGWRSYMAAASDVAAMGARPWCALCALVLPDDVDDDALEAIARGQRDAAAAVGAPVVGGNLARGPALSIATTLLGTCDAAVQRAGARPGDGLWMAGEVGLAAAGLRALQDGRGGDPRLEPAIRAWRSPRALVAEGLAMAGVAHAAVDVSDGLARDADHIAEASAVRLVLDEAELRADDVLGAVAAALGEDPVALALHGGEDYALVVASPRPITGFRAIGRVVAGTGVALRTATGERDLAPGGYDHFTSGKPREASRS
jgi:thiamine-monophosphate kinase